MDGRFRTEGVDGLADRSPRPLKLHRPTSDETAQTVIDLRRQRLSGKHIARIVKLSRATVSRILRAARLSKARDLEPALPPNRYERAAPGDMIHLDIKNLGALNAPDTGSQVIEPGNQHPNRR